MRGHDNLQDYTGVVHISDKTTNVELVVHPDRDHIERSSAGYFWLLDALA
jgi:hypothetical protein